MEKFEVVIRSEWREAHSYKFYAYKVSSTGEETLLNTVGAFEVKWLRDQLPKLLWNENVEVQRLTVSKADNGEVTLEEQVPAKAVSDGKCPRCDSYPKCDGCSWNGSVSHRVRTEQGAPC